MKRSILSLGIIFLFILSAFNPMSFGYTVKTSIRNNSGNTLYVGGSGPNNYTTIQSAIDDAVDGDTVYVYDDSSPYSKVIIDKSINLIGENKDSTIIDGNNSFIVVNIKANGVNINGFTIQNSGQEYEGIWCVSDGNNITENNIVDNYLGIVLYNSCFNNIVNNEIINCSDGIAVFTNSNNNSIIRNSIYKNKRGIRISSSTNNLIYRNKLLENTDKGIIIYFSKENLIKCNNITKNFDHAISIEYFSHNNTVIGNLITKNYRDGIVIGYETNSNLIYSNHIEDNTFGIWFWNRCNNNSVVRNIFKNNNKGTFTSVSVYDNEIYHNNYFNNKYNAEDDFSNIYDNGYPSGGNYWDDYNGTDADGDGIGDTPYSIPDGDNEDRYPLIEPFGTNPPNAPIIDGQIHGTIGVEYTYTFYSTDEDNDSLFYLVNWGDGSPIEFVYPTWPSPEEPGPGIANHSWDEKGEYIIKVRAEEEFGYIGPVGKFRINMPRDKTTTCSLLQRWIEHYPLLNRLLNLVK